MKAILAAIFGTTTVDDAVIGVTKAITKLDSVIEYQRSVAAHQRTIATNAALAAGLASAEADRAVKLSARFKALVAA